jgi:dipeptidase E
MKLLLVSNSTLHGSGYLDHCEKEILTFLGESIRSILFIPFARPSGITHDEYTAKARERYEQMGISLTSIHETDDMQKAVAEAESIFIGGGNSFVLAGQLHNYNLIEPIAARVRNGMPYIGTSAGSNVACPTIMTTNDMPIIQPKSFSTLNLVPFQINPHYLDPDPDSTHKGETRETRIKEFLAFNDKKVIGLREGAMILADGNKKLLKGTTGARIFERSKEPYEILPGDDVGFLF